MRAYLVNRTPEPAELGYSNSPLWQLPKALAEQQCLELNGYEAKWFPLHHCHFELEEVAAGRYALVCPDHPAISG